MAGFVVGIVPARSNFQLTNTQQLCKMLNCQRTSFSMHTHNAQRTLSLSQIFWFIMPSSKDSNKATIFIHIDVWIRTNIYQATERIVHCFNASWFLALLDSVHMNSTNRNVKRMFQSGVCVCRVVHWELENLVIFQVFKQLLTYTHTHMHIHTLSLLSNAIEH